MKTCPETVLSLVLRCHILKTSRVNRCSLNVFHWYPSVSNTEASYTKRTKMSCPKQCSHRFLLTCVAERKNTARKELLWKTGFPGFLIPEWVFLFPIPLKTKAFPLLGTVQFCPFVFALQTNIYARILHGPGFQGACRVGPGSDRLGFIIGIVFALCVDKPSEVRVPLPSNCSKKLP